MNPNPSASPLLLQAFRYLVDEMTAAESRQFEDLLADDPLACEALADAVQLQAALAGSAELAAHASAPRNSRPRLQRFPGVLTVSVLGLLLAVTAIFWNAPREDGITTLASSTDPELQRLWAAIASQEQWTDRESLEEEVELTDSDDVLEQGAEFVPDWMFAAVAAEQKFRGDGEPSLNSTEEGTL